MYVYIITNNNLIYVILIIYDIWTYTHMHVCTYAHIFVHTYIHTHTMLGSEWFWRIYVCALHWFVAISAGVWGHFLWLCLPMVYFDPKLFCAKC